MITPATGSRDGDGSPDGARTGAGASDPAIETIDALDPFDARIAAGATGLLRTFNEAGVLAAADVHVAMRLGALTAESSEAVLLAAALAVRAPRLGHVYVDLDTVRETAAVESETGVEIGALPWPDPGAWPAAVAARRLCGDGEDDPSVAPLRLVDGSHLYLDRLWQEERQVAADLAALAGGAVADVDEARLADGVARLFPGEGASRQAQAAASAVLRRLTIVAGGPGTGKTTTVSRIVALLAEQAAGAGAPPPLVALAAPTGKAAARLGEAVRAAAPELDVGPEVRALLADLEATTIHRLLGRRPDSHSRFRHDRGRRLPHDVVVVDETSMVSLTLMARLVEAVRPDARLVLVGDPDQLVSIEAGAVLGALIGPARVRPRMTAPARDTLAAVTGALVDALPPPPAADGFGDGIVVLDRVHRFGGAIARLAEAIRAGDADAVLAELAGGAPAITWLDADSGELGGRGEPGPPALAAVREPALAAARAVAAAARAGDARRALSALGAFRLLCAHRRGPDGVAAWAAHVEAWLGPEISPVDPWYVGRPLLITRNDPELGLFNGDTGVVVATGATGATGADGAVAAAFPRGDGVVLVPPVRLSFVETVHAMTIHKSQGSQFGTAAVLLPEPDSRLLTRELLYTAATRARERLLVVGSRAAVVAAVERPVARASGLRTRLWGDGADLGEPPPAPAPPVEHDV